MAGEQDELEGTGDCYEQGERSELLVGPQTERAKGVVERATHALELYGSGGDG